MPLLIENLVKTFPQPGGGELTVLDVPSLRLDAGEQVALIGQSGGGKTTLLHLIAGLLTPTSGTLSVAGVDLTRLSEQGRDRVRASAIGYVFQTFNLLPAFSAIENVRLGMSFGNATGGVSRGMEMLDMVGLADRADYKPAQLSVGQQQRVAIARSLAGRPKILLADEPTANVDPASAENVLSLIEEACTAAKITLLMVTHSRDVASRFGRVERLEAINRVLAGDAHDTDA